MSRSEDVDPTEETIRALPLWHGPIDISPLSGGITNRNFVVRDGTRRAVVRVGGDIPVHGIMRFNEHAASRAAAAAGISPAVIATGPGLLVLDYIEGQTFDAAMVRARRDDCTALVARAHRDMTDHLRGPLLSFNTFHILRDYGHALRDGDHRLLDRLAEFADRAARLERAAGAVDLVFGHNDLLAANFIDDGRRLWLLDWDYAGFNTPLFDLGGLSSNNGFGAEDDDAMLALYYDRAPTDELRRRFKAVQCASLLREAMWSMVSELHSDLEFDYIAYTGENLARFEAAWTLFLDME
ncbi:choline kinase family protein [Zavarzinia aquatilis]|uniref:Choline kinase n=1 Tax=Zavarzinia aquatilis TaxID=2211142 RepID=A0A317DYI2_9PROT|nr:choline kinase family protein [Zavarzinia aquatilis]PWR19414.1 choline kinase [Zavarzinia aquatilis]